MSQTYKGERWLEFYGDAHFIMKQHWEEIAIDRETIELALNEDSYSKMENEGILHVLAFRVDGHLAGYYIAFLLPHIHYKNAGLMAFTDIYYIAPQHRRAANGIMLFREAERTLKERGVVKAYCSTKVHKDNSRILEFLGWNLTDKVFTKLF